MTVFALVCAFIGLVVLAVAAGSAFVWCAQWVWRCGKARHAAWVGWLRTTAEYLGLVEQEGTSSRCAVCMTVIWWGREAYEPPEWICPLCAHRTAQRGQTQERRRGK